MSTRSISLEARERLRAQQAKEAKVVSGHTTARARLEAAVHKRAAILAAHDRLVAAAEGDVAVAAFKVVSVSGFARASALLGTAPPTLRRQLAEAKANCQKEGPTGPFARTGEV